MPPIQAKNSEENRMMQKITPFLWFDNQAEEAMNFYYFDLQELEGGSNHPLWRRRTRTEGKRHDRLLRAGGYEVYRPERRPDLQVHRGDLVRRRLRDAGGGRLLLEQALGGRRSRAMRVAEGQVRPLVADRPFGAAETAERPRSGEGEPRHAGDAADDEDRHRRAGAGGEGLASAAAADVQAMWAQSERPAWKLSSMRSMIGA